MTFHLVFNNIYFVIGKNWNEVPKLHVTNLKHQIGGSVKDGKVAHSWTVPDLRVADHQNLTVHSDSARLKPFT